MLLYYEKKDSNITVSTRPNRVGCSAHLHHHIEIVVVLSGIVDVRLDSSEYRMYGGDVIIAFPNQVHEYTDITENRSIVIIFPPDYCREFESIFNQKLPVYSVVHDSDGFFQQTALELSRLHTDNPPFVKALARGHILFFLSRLFSEMQLRDADKTDLPMLRNILHYCDDNYSDESLSLGSVARALNVNKYYVSHIFNDKLKMSFTDYISSLRVNDSCLRLRETNANVSEVAYSVGFNSIRTFNRHFSQLTGMTPSQYRTALFSGGESM